MRIAAWALGTLAFWTPAQGATLHVCPDGTGDYSNLQAAVAAASSGDTIELCDGVFTGPENVDLHFGNRDLVLRSIYGPESTTIDFAWLEDGGDGDELFAHPGIVLEAGTTTRIEGVTLNGAGNRLPGDPGDGSTIHSNGGHLTLDRVHLRSPFTGSRRARRGGGVFVQGAALTASECVFQGFAVTEEGAALYADGSAIVLRQCAFRGNNNGDGGSLWLGSGAEITGCIFERNQGPANPGVVIAVDGGQVVVTGSTFWDNFAECIRNRGQLLVQDCLFGENTADDGPAITNSGTATVVRSTFRDNLAGIWAGAVVNYGTMSIEECLFVRNQGGYSQLWSVTVAGYRGTLSVRGCTFFGNRTGGYDRTGAALKFGTGTTGIIEQTIVAQGERSSAVACEGEASHLAVTCCDFFGNEEGDWVGCVEGLAGSAGNISADPLFCDIAAEDFHLRASSPCAPPQSGDCGPIGAFPAACGTTHLRSESWGRIKVLFR